VQELDPAWKSRGVHKLVRTLEWHDLQPDCAPHGSGRMKEPGQGRASLHEVELSSVGRSWCVDRRRVLGIESPSWRRRSAATAVDEAALALPTSVSALDRWAELGCGGAGSSCKCVRDRIYAPYGRATCRRTTASWCRSTTISSSLNSSERKLRSESCRTTRSARYTSDRSTSTASRSTRRRPPDSTQTHDADHSWAWLAATFVARRCLRSNLCTPHASLTMIDRHYGHLARDGRDHAINLLDAFTDPETVNVHAVDAAWTSEA
jgi:hypothetical protein